MTLPNPMDVVKAGIRAVPAVKYALGIAGIAAALALVAAFFSSVQAALIGIAAMLILMVLLLVFSAASTLPKNFLKYPALVMTWSTLIIFVGSVFLVAASVFFDKPKPFPLLISQILKPSKPNDIKIGYRHEGYLGALYDHLQANVPVSEFSLEFGNRNRTEIRSFWVEPEKFGESWDELLSKICLAYSTCLMCTPAPGEIGNCVKIELIGDKSSLKTINQNPIKYQCKD